MISAPRPTRVLMVDPNAHSLPYDHALCRALAAAGCEVVLATSPFLYDSPPPAEGFEVAREFFTVALGGPSRVLGLERRPTVRRAFKAVEYPLDWLGLLLEVMRSRPAVVHLQWSLSPALDLVIWRTIRRAGARVVYTVHNLLPHAPAPADAGRFGRLYRAADGVVTHTRRTADVLRRRFRVRPERIAVAAHGPLFEDEPEIDRARARALLRLPPDAPIVLFAGLLEPYKGLGDLIDAFGRVARCSPSALLVVAGRENLPFRPFREQIERAGLGDRFRVDLGFHPQSRFAAYLQAADIVALPYREITSSGLFMAARRFAAPVVATDVGDFAELVADGETGLLVPPGNPAALAAALNRLLADPQFARQLGEQGRRQANAQASWASAAGATIELYRRILRL